MAMDRAEQARDVVAKQLRELGELVADASRTGTDTGFERLKRWKARTADLLRKEVHQDEGDRLAEKRKTSWRMGDPHGNLVDEAQMYEGFLLALHRELEQHPDSVLQPAVASAVALVAPEPAPTTPAKPVIFVVHGHDELNLLRLKELIRERWKVESIVLAGEPGRGRTIIEKFEEEAQRATFAFVLMSPDDQVAVAGGEYAQSRPNVIFELGWFYGRLGRERVCILFKKGTKIHSDLDGVSRIEFSSSVTEKIEEIERELVDAKVLTGNGGAGV
jgi:predicted nucleotide-binding protein